MPADAGPARAAPRRFTPRQLLVLACAWLPVVLGRDAVARAAALHGLAASPNPYFIPGQALLLYVAAPIVLVSACVAIMTPGLLLTRSSAAGGASAWIMRAFGVTLPLVSAAASFAQLASGTRIVGAAFLAVLAVVSIAALGIPRLVEALGVQRLAGVDDGADSEPTTSGQRAAVVGLLIAVPAGLFVALAPKFLWESVNGDGGHAMLTAKLAVRQFLPFWDPSAGDVASFPGLSTVLFAYPASWFVRLFGETEVAIRAPYLLVLAATHAAIVAVASHGRTPLRAGSQALVWMGLAVYTVVQAYSATYDPYSADLSMPGLPDTLQVFTFLGVVHAHLARRWGWCALFLALTLVSSPSGLMLVVFWLGGIVLCGGPAERGSALRLLGGLIALMLALAVTPAVLEALSLPVPGREHGVTGLLRRFRYLQFTEWRRFLWVLVPCGIFPFLAVASGWRRIDAAGRALMLVAAALFLVFFVQAFVSLHQFAPAMLLPLAAMWRGDWSGRTIWQSPAAAAPLALLALLLSLPTHAAPILAARQIGQSIQRPAGDGDGLDPASLRRLELLSTLFPKDFEPAVPHEVYGGSPLAWGVYAHRNPETGDDTNYVLGALDDPAPPGARRHAGNDDGVLYVRSDAVWQRHRALRPATPAGSWLYGTPRTRLFGTWPLEDGPWVLDVRKTLERVGKTVKLW